jgi:hypothetical protein
LPPASMSLLRFARRLAFEIASNTAVFVEHLTGVFDCLRHSAAGKNKRDRQCNGNLHEPRLDAGALRSPVREDWPAREGENHGLPVGMGSLKSEPVGRYHQPKPAT